MKKKQTLLFLFLMPFIFPTLQAQDVAICGWDGSGSSSSGDEVSFVLLRDFSAGEVIYITEDEYVSSTGNFNSTEGHLAFTVPAGGLLTNEVVSIVETSSGVYSDQCGSGGTVTGFGSWSLVLDALGGMSDEIYAYSASNPVSPWSSITEIHCFVWSATFDLYSNPGTGGGTVDQVPSFDYPDCIDITFNIGGAGGVNANFLDAARTNTTLADLNVGGNWAQSANTNISLSCTDFTAQMIVLPVELVAFEAKRKDENIALNWTTASEVNNDYFEVQRSEDGVDFKRIGTVDGKGNTLFASQYSFIDEKPINGYIYYRLKQVDFDSNIAYSDIVSVEYRNADNEIMVYPNPFEQSVTVEFSNLDRYSSVVNDQSIEVYDTNGKLVHRISSVSESIVTIDLSILSPGVYLLQSISDQQNISTKRITKL